MEKNYNSLTTAGRYILNKKGINNDDKYQTTWWNCRK